MTTNNIPFVFLPGFLCDERLWQHQIAALSSIAPTRVVDLRYCQSFQEMIESVSKMPWPKFHLVGFSMGGYVAQGFAIQNADRIASLTIVAANGSTLSKTEIDSRLKMEALLQRAHYKGISTKELQRFVHPDSWNNPAVTEVVRAMSAGNTSEMYLNQMKATLHREDFKERLQSLSFPIALVGGQQDQVVTSDEMEGFHRAVPRSRLFFFSPCGHYVPLEQPTVLTSLIRNFTQKI